MNEDVVRNTVQKMRDAGLSETVISSTLSDLGLSAAQTQAFLAGGNKPMAASPSTSIPSPPKPSDGEEEMGLSDMDHETIASRTSEKVVQQLDERNLLNEETQSLKDNITHLAMEQHGQQLQETHQSVMELHDKLDSASLDTMSNRLSTVNARVDQMQKDVSDMKALMGALQSLMQKILETNQQILFEMKTKK